MELIGDVISFIFEYRFIFLFYLIVFFLVYTNRNKFESPARLMYLYRTKVGLKLMDSMSAKFRKPIKILGYFGVIIAYAGFILVSVLLTISAYDLVINKPGAMGGSPVIPGLPIAGLGITFPLIIGWISLFIILVVHEFSHGVVARAHNIKIKSSGIAFFGPILGAFVEPDDKQMKKQKHRAQHSVLAAGPISNIFLYLFCMFLIFFLATGITSIASPGGVQVDITQNESFPAYSSGMEDGEIITEINGITTINSTGFFSALENISAGQGINIKLLSGKTYNLTAISHPLNESKGLIGINNFKQHYIAETPQKEVLLSVFLWLSELLFWTGFLSINIGLLNLFPIFITDGAQMLRLNFEFIFKKNKEKATRLWAVVNWIALFMVLILLFFPLIRSILNYFI